MAKTLNSLWDPPFPFPRGAEDVPPKGILAAGPGLTELLKIRAPETLKKRCHLFGRGGTALYAGRDFFLAGPVLGAPMAVMALEILSGGGAEELLFSGYAGSLRADLRPGSLFLPERALSTEGVSAHYSPDLSPDPSLLEKLRKTARETGFVRSGTVWTTDAPMRETPKLRERQKKLGAEAVEMEVSAVFSAARFRALKAAALLLITDVFDEDGWRGGPGGRERGEALEPLLKLAWKTLAAPL
ncbi:MAG: hypothetical protein LBR53_13485 [Deltaproteobacteria bacterium]|jgi:purine-nucleoside phosphorylase|nr:hypothetical protein [Deltaproteobacteria bacterium]